MDENIFCVDKKPKHYYVRDREEILKYFPQNSKKILDIGCGAGNFGKILKAHMDAEVWGVEISKEAAVEAEKKLDKIVIGDIESDNLNLPGNYFDCIVFNDVLEHLKNPWNVLKRCKDNLKNKGHIVASIPNVRYYANVRALLVNKSWDYVDEGILDKTHLRFFTEKTIKDMFVLCGYHIEKIKGIHECNFSRKMKFLNYLFRNAFCDMKYLQFVVIAEKKR